MEVESSREYDQVRLGRIARYKQYSSRAKEGLDCYMEAATRHEAEELEGATQIERRMSHETEEDSATMNEGGVTVDREGANMNREGAAQDE